MTDTTTPKALTHLPCLDCDADIPIVADAEDVVCPNAACETVFEIADKGERLKNGKKCPYSKRFKLCRVKSDEDSPEPPSKEEKILKAFGKIAPKNPFGLKSVAHSTVPSTDPAAPFGRDENYRPIMPERTDIALAQAASEQIAREPEIEPRPRTKEPAPYGGGVLGNHDGQGGVLSSSFEQELLAERDFQERVKEHIENVQSLDYRVRPPGYLPPLFGLSRDWLLDLLDTPVPGEFTTKFVDGDKLLKDRAPVKARAAELREVIREAKRKIETWTVRWMKKNRTDDVDVWPSEKDRRAWSEAERRVIKSADDELRGINTRLKNWDKRPENWFVKKNEVQVPVLFSAKIEPPSALGQGQWNDKIKVGQEYLPDGRQIGSFRFVFTVSNYRDLMTLSGDALAVLEELHTNWNDWRDWENECLIEAIVHRLIPITPELWGSLKIKIPRLRDYKFGDEDGGRVEDNLENQITLKTGGANLGASIHGNGWRDGARRPLQSFEKYDGPRRKGSKRGGFFSPGEPGGGADSGSFMSDMDSGDIGEE